MEDGIFDVSIAAQYLTSTGEFRVVRDTPAGVWTAIDSNAVIRLEQTRGGAQAGDPLAVIIDASMADPYKVQTFFDASGGYQSGRWIVSSQKRALHTPGDITKGSNILPVSSVPAAGGLEPVMICASCDVPGPAFGGECYTNDATNPNDSAYAAYDLDDPHTGPFGGYSGGYGRKKFIIKGNGDLRWGPDLQLSHAANHDLYLKRVQGAVMGIGDPQVADADIKFQLRTHSAQGATLSLGRNGSNDYLRLSTNTGIADFADINLNNREVLRMYSNMGTGTGVVIGGTDVGNAVGAFVVGAGHPAYVNALVARGKATQSEPIMRIEDSGGNLLSGFSKGGYFVTEKHAAPADGDLTAGQMVVWFDQTNGAAKMMVKAKQADGTVKTGSLALA